MSRRFRAPAGNGDVLADPPFADVPRLVAENRRRLDRADVFVGGMPLRDLRGLARRELRPGVPTDTPLILAGHQPELSHPGVWAKNFALNAIARRVGGAALNLIVDNDTLKSTALRFPATSKVPTGVHLQSVAFDRFDRDEPYEDRKVHDPQLFRTFAERAAPVWANWGVEPLLPHVWQDIVADSSPTIGGKFAAVRRKWERKWGCDNCEVTVSRLASTRAFGIFAEWLAHHTPFQSAYNAYVWNYREQHGIRSRHHPVPDLVENADGGKEYPFWVTDLGTGRRGRLFVAMDSHADRRYWVDRQPRAGWSDIAPFLRPRALTLTLFARVCLGDFFVHGIGGGIYDQVTDWLIGSVVHVEPPAYQVVSATLHLPLPAFPTTPADVLALARRERDAHWNPHRYLPESDPDARELVERHRQLEAAEPPDSAGRKQRFRDLRAVNDALRPRVEGAIARTREDLRRAREEAAANAALMRRDFSWVLYPEATLRPFLQRFLDV